MLNNLFDNINLYYDPLTIDNLIKFSNSIFDLNLINNLIQEKFNNYFNNFSNNNLIKFLLFKTINPPVDKNEVINQSSLTIYLESFFNNFKILVEESELFKTVLKNQGNLMNRFILEMILKNLHEIAYCKASPNIQFSMNFNKVSGSIVETLYGMENSEMRNKILINLPQCADCLIFDEKSSTIELTEIKSSIDGAIKNFLLLKDTRIELKINGRPKVDQVHNFKIKFRESAFLHHIEKVNDVSFSIKFNKFERTKETYDEGEPIVINVMGIEDNWISQKLIANAMTIIFNIFEKLSINNFNKQMFFSDLKYFIRMRNRIPEDNYIDASILRLKTKNITDNFVIMRWGEY